LIEANNLNLTDKLDWDFTMQEVTVSDRPAFLLKQRCILLLKCSSNALTTLQWWKKVLQQNIHKWIQT